MLSKIDIATETQEATRIIEFNGCRFLVDNLTNSFQYQDGNMLNFVELVSLSCLKQWVEYKILLQFSQKQKILR